MNKYEKHPFEDLTDSQLDEIMAYAAPMTAASVGNVYKRFRSGRREIQSKKYPMRLIAALVAVFAVALVGFTNVDNIQRLFQMLFGGAVQLEQTDYSSIGKSVTDNGFRMDVISAVRDSENLYLLAQLFDVEGDRLSEDIYIDSGTVTGVAKIMGENVAAMSGIKTNLLEYDKANQTAIFGIHARGEFLADEAVYRLRSFGNDKKSVSIDAAEINLYTLALNSSGQFIPFEAEKYDDVGLGANEEMDIEDISDCMALDVMDVHFPGYEREYISNIAYRDGLLHLQLNDTQRGRNNRVYLSLRNIRTGEELVDLYDLSYGTYSPDFPNGAEHYAVHHTEHVYRLDRLESLKDYAIHVEGEYYENVYHGDWQVRFDAPQEVTSVNLPVTGSVMVGGKQIEIKKVTVTPLSVVITSGDKTDNSFDVSLIYKDGTKKPLTESGMYIYGNGEQERHYTGVFRFQEIAKVVINDVGFDMPQ